MNWKGFFVVLIVLLVIYGVYYLVTEANILQLLSIPRALDPFATSTPGARTSPRSSGTLRGTTPTVSAPTVRTPTPPKGFEVADLSSYFDGIQLVSVRRPDRYGIGGEFTLRANASVGSAVDVTGWTISSNRGSIVIFGAHGSIGPVNQARIVIRPGTSAIFYAARGSFVNNVELNSCTGYLNEIYAVSPKFPNNCPRPPRSDLVSFSGECQNFITSLSSCEAPDPNERNRFTGTSDVACRAYLDTLAYGPCVNRYRDLPNFYSHGWRVWMGAALKFDPYHDRLLLFDATGKLVDEYIY